MNRSELTREIRTVLTNLVNELPNARTQLREWTGEYPASVHGAAPATGPTPISDDDEAELTKLETDALGPDRARKQLDQLDGVIGKLSALALHTLIANRQTPDPAERTPRLDIIRQAYAPPLIDTIGTKRLLWSYRLLEQAVTICRGTQPTATHRAGQNCHAHEKAGDPNVDADAKYRHLCGWCGRFKNTHGQYPPAELVRLHDRGIRIMPAHLRRAGIKVA